MSDKILTYLDTGVLIDAIRGQGARATAAAAILDDPRRAFVGSDFVRIELLPKALYHKRALEVEVLSDYFQSCVAWARPSDAILEEAMRQGRETGASGIDACHLGAAVVAGAHELITTENPVHPIARCTAVKVTSLYIKPGA